MESKKYLKYLETLQNIRKHGKYSALHIYFVQFRYKTKTRKNLWENTDESKRDLFGVPTFEEFRV